MQRSELIDFILRIASHFVYQQFSGKDKVVTHLPKFLDRYVNHVISKSNIIEHRTSIRHSTRLNELLYDNRQALYQIFKEGKLLDAGGRKGFTLTCTREFIAPLNGIKDFHVSNRVIE